MKKKKEKAKAIERAEVERLDVRANLWMNLETLTAQHEMQSKVWTASRNVSFLVKDLLRLVLNRDRRRRRLRLRPRDSYNLVALKHGSPRWLANAGHQCRQGHFRDYCLYGNPRRSRTKRIEDAKRTDLTLPAADSKIVKRKPRKRWPSLRDQRLEELM